MNELEEFVAELRDRFGGLPEEVDRMVIVKRLQLLAHSWKIDDIHLEEGYAVFGYNDQLVIQELARGCGDRLRVVDHRQAYLVLDADLAEQDELLQELVDVLAD